MYFAAIELKKGEKEETAIRHFVLAAADNNIRFKKLQSFGPFEFANAKFIRFQTDCSTYPPIVSRLKVDGRAVIAPEVGGYKAFLANGREGQVGTVLMQGTARPGHGKVYLGSSHQFWQAQFA
jgi:hypothetical protein